MLDSFLAILDRYPGAWTVIGPMLAAAIWAVVSGLFNTVYDSRSPHTDEEWALAFDRHPRWSAIVSVFKTAGLNIPGLLRSLRAFFGGPLPTPVLAIMSGSKPPAGQALRDAARLMAEEQLRASREIVGLPPLPPAVIITPEAAPTPRESER